MQILPPTLLAHIFNRFPIRNRIIAISVFLNFAGFTLIIPVLPFSVSRYVPNGDIATWVAIIIALYALCTFISAPVLGTVSDALGRRPVILFSLLGSAFGFMLFGVGGALWVLIAGRIIEGLTAGSISAMYAYVADTNEPNERGPVFGMLGAFGGLGFLLGPLVGGLLSHISFSAPFYGAAGLALCNAALVYLYMPESCLPRQRSVCLNWSQFNPFSQLTFIFGEPHLKLVFAIIFCFTVGSAVLQTNLAVMLKDVMAFEPTDIGLLLALVGMFDMFSQGLVAPKVLRLFGSGRVAMVGLFINALGLATLAVLAMHPSQALLALGIFLFTFGDGLFQPSAASFLSANAPEREQGIVHGANQAQQSVARMATPLATAWLYSLAASAPYWMAAIIVLMAASILYIRSSR